MCFRSRDKKVLLMALLSHIYFYEFYVRELQTWLQPEHLPHDKYLAGPLK